MRQPQLRTDTQLFEIETKMHEGLFALVDAVMEMSPLLLHLLSLSQSLEWSERWI